MKNKIAYIGCLSIIGIITTAFGVIGILPQIADYYHITIDKAGLLLSAFVMKPKMISIMLLLFGVTGV